MRWYALWLLCLVLCGSGALHARWRVASLNLAKQCGPQIVKVIENEPDLRKADVLLLQEVVDGPSCHMAADAARALGFQFVFARAFKLNEKLDEGLAILSRYPLGPASITPLPHNSLHFHTRIRIALAATVETPHGPVKLVNTHLDNRINARSKHDQLAEIWRETGRDTGPCLVGGDFNNANFRWISHFVPLPGMQSLRGLVDKEMQEHGFRTPLGAGPGTLHFMGLKLDWIYLRGLAASNSGVTPIRFSDHNSVWVAINP